MHHHMHNTKTQCIYIQVLGSLVLSAPFLSLSPPTRSGSEVNRKRGWRRETKCWAPILYTSIMVLYIIEILLDRDSIGQIKRLIMHRLSIKIWNSWHL